MLKGKLYTPAAPKDGQLELIRSSFAQRLGGEVQLEVIVDPSLIGGVRVEIDERGETIGYKIREARQVDRVPYMLILGEQERDGGYISVRDRSNETVQSSLEDFLDKIGTEIAERL